MSVFRMNRLPKHDGSPLTGNRSMFDFVTKEPPAKATLALPKASHDAPAAKLGDELLSDTELAAGGSDEDANESTTERKRKTYDDKFKRKALQLAVLKGVNNACRELKISSGTLCRWKLQFADAQQKRLHEAPANTPAVPATLEEELAMLADGRAGNGSRVPLEVEQGMYAFFYTCAKR
jgi:transposase-like protein